MTDLGTLPGGSDSVAQAINARGQTVGFSRVAGVDHAVLWEDGMITDLDSLVPSGFPFDFIQAYSINDRGQIVGVGQPSVALLLTP